MANIKTLGGAVVDVAGAPLVGKTVSLKNDTSGALITTVVTDARGEWAFANRDETLRYRVEAAVGGSGAQVVVRKPASAEFDHAYINTSLRSAAAATIALGGPVSLAGGLTVSAGGIVVTGNSTITGALTLTSNLIMSGVSAAVEVGSTASPNTPILDFHSSGNANDYDSRIIGSGGAAGAGQGILTINAASLSIAAAVGIGGALTVAGALVTGGANATTELLNTVTAKPVLRIQGMAGQSGDLLQVRQNSGGLPFSVEANGQVNILGTANLSGNIGFFGTMPATGPRTVTGSRGGNAALLSLLLELQTLGLIINSTT